MRSKTVLILLAAMTAFCAYPKPMENDSASPEPPVLVLSVKTSTEAVPSPGETEIVLSVTIPRGYHLFAGEDLKLSLSGRLGTGRIAYPKPETEEGFDIYRGTVNIPISVKVPPLLDGEVKSSVKLEWQGCQDFGDKVCFMPETSEASFSFKVKASSAKENAPPPPAPTDSTAKTAPAAVTGGSGTVPDLDGFREKGRFAGFLSPRDFHEWYSKTSAGDSAGDENLFSKVAKENILLAIMVAFLFGFLSSLTPCVYPVIPITIAYIGSRASGKGKLSGFVLSLFFVLGLALVYSTLGVISSLLGVSFGSLTQKPAVGLFVAFVFLLLGLSMMGLFEIAMPSRWTGKIEAEKKKGKGYLGAFFIGALSGLVASPCIGPLLLAILVIVASIGSAFLGFVYLFAFALGMGILFILIGTFSGLLSSLPKSGGWMDFVKIIFGAMIIAAAFYFGAMYLSAAPFFLLSGAVLGFVIAFLVFGASRHFFPVPARVIGSLLLVAAFAGILPFTPHMPGKAAAPEKFMTDLGAAMKKAGEENKPLLLDFRADWCAACLELEEKTWPSEEAGKVFAEVIPVKMDFTKESETRSRLEERFKIKGLPTVILLEPLSPGEGNAKNTGD